jgi:hypothetical protein
MELVAHMALDTPHSAFEFRLSEAVLPGAAGMKNAHEPIGKSV